MKGIILAGGLGSRLRPATYIVNKNILPVYRKPAIFYSIEMLARAGIEEIAIIAEYHYHEDFKTILGNGTDFGVQLEFINDTPYKKGPASAIYYAKNFVNEENVATIFADGVYDTCIKDDVENFKSGALVFLKEVNNPSSFGIAKINKKGQVLSFEEKPENPQSNLAFTGLAIYDSNLFDYIEMITPGIGGEYYTTDVNSIYLKKDNLQGKVVDGFWQDIGTFDGLLDASNYWRDKENLSKVT